jgi:hypothetical protein
MLKIFHNGLDLSREQSRYEYLPNVIDFQDGDLQVGYYKPISALFVNLLKNTDERNLSLKYYDGISWVEVSNLKDLTFGLKSPSFITWSKNQVNEKKTTLNDQELYWYKVSSTSTDPVTFKGISMLFSDDFDLIAAYPSIMNHLPEGQETFVRFHEEAAKDIINDLRRTGIVINNNLMDSSKRKKLDVFDLMDFEEVRESAKYFTLSKIFGWLSDAPNDKWQLLEAKFEAEAAGSLTPLITIDENDNGLLDESEQLQPNNVVYVGRL